MPREDFYAGLTLAQQLQKLADHHSDPKVRHISQDEDSILNRAVARLEQPLTHQQADDDFEQVWRILSQIYTTTIVSDDGDRHLLVVSIPTRRDSAVPPAPDVLGDLTTIGIGAASPRTAQIALNLLVRHERDPSSDLQEVWAALMKRRSPPTDPLVDARDHEFLNRVLYQPTVAVEQSPPVFTSASSVFAAADPANSWIATIIDDVGNPVALGSTLGMFLVFKLFSGPIAGISEGLRERLYEWIRPPPGD